MQSSGKAPLRMGGLQRSRGSRLPACGGFLIRSLNPVPVRLLLKLLAAAGSRNAELVAVLGHRAAGKNNPLLLHARSKLLVG